MNRRKARLWLYRFGCWLAARGMDLAEWAIPTPPAPPAAVVTLTVQKDDLYDRAVALVAHWRGSEVDGQYKRHQVFGQLVKEFPTRAKAALSQAIEAAYSGV